MSSRLIPDAGRRPGAGEGGQPSLPGGRRPGPRWPLGPGTRILGRAAGDPSARSPRERGLRNLVLQPLLHGRRADPCPAGCSPYLGPGVGGRGGIWRGSLFDLGWSAYAMDCSGLGSLGLDLRGGYSAVWFSSDEGPGVTVLLRVSRPHWWVFIAGLIQGRMSPE